MYNAWAMIDGTGSIAERYHHTPYGHRTALTQRGHAGRLYEVTGPRLLTFAQAVQGIAHAWGKPLTYQPITAEAFAAGAWHQEAVPS